METKKTHWKKNNDSNYVSGEDLFNELKGLLKDFPVKLSSFSDGETFDQNAQAKTVKTVLQFTDLNGVKLYKGVLLNNTSAKFFIKEFGSEFIEDWINKPCNIFAQADRRHGYVVRFKKYYKPVVQVDIKGAELILNSCDSLESLGKAWSSLNSNQQKNSKVIELKNKLKIELTNEN
tara:strand:+ start:1538 stop:2068 length:531 start_codon:yes stop_codon:yes gene_type:complete